MPIGAQSTKNWWDLQGLTSKDRSSPVNVRKRQSYTKVESGNNGIRWSKSKMKKLVDTIIEVAPLLRRDLCWDQS